MSEPAGRHEYRAEMLLLIVVVVWAANYPVAKWAIAGMNVYVFNAIRFVVAAIVLASMFLYRSRWMPVAADDWRKLIGAGVVANVLYQVVFMAGLSMTTAGNSAVLLSTSPLWTIFFNARLHKEKISSMLWIGMLVSLSGIALIILGSGKRIEFGGYALTGDLITLTAAMLWGLNTNLQKPLLTKYSVLQLALVMMVVGAIGLLLVATPSLGTFDWGSLHWTYYLAAIGSGALSIGICNVLWTNGVKRLGPGRTANFNNLVPVLAVMFSYFSLREEISVLQIVGICITMGGVWVARR